MQRNLLVPVAILLALIVAAGATLGALSVGDGGDEEAGPIELREPAQERERDRVLDRLPELEPFIDELLPEFEPFIDGLASALAPQPFVGIVLAERGGAVVVQGVFQGSPASRAGIREGDVIEAVDGVPASSAAEVAERVRASEPDDLLTFRVRDDGVEREFEVRVGRRPGLPDVPELPEGGLRSLLPDDLPEFFERSLLGGRLGELFERFIEAGVTFLGDEGERVTLRVSAGTIDSVANRRIVVAPNGGGSEQEFTVAADTRVVRGLRSASVDDLEPGDRVIVVARGEGKKATVVLAFPAE